MKSLVLFSLVICFAVIPLRAKPSSNGELDDLFKRIISEMRYNDCQCDKTSDREHKNSVEYSVEVSQKRSYDEDQQEAQMQKKRCQCGEQDNDSGVSERAVSDNYELPEPGHDMPSGKRNRLQGGDGYQTNLLKATKTADPCQGILAGAIPLEMLVYGLQSADENGDGAFDEAEMKKFAMSLELLKRCYNWT